jgi:hypothetical protein
MAKLLYSPTSVLLEQALVLWHENSETDERWDVFYTLGTRGDDETLDAAKIWCANTDATKRELAANLLNQFGERIFDNNGRGVTFPSAGRVVPLLEKLIDDPEAGVIASAIIGLGWYSAYEIILARPSLSTHASPSVRFAVACGLNGAESKAAIDILIALASDEDDEVRDRASWVLGCESMLDTPEIRQALMRNLDDWQTDTRCEALVGLARRKDARVIPHIKKELAAVTVYYVAIEAAGHIASPELVKPLEELRSRWDEDKDLLERALICCKGLSDPKERWLWGGEDNIFIPNWVTDMTES